MRRLGAPAALLLVLLAAVPGCAREEARPEGIAERWLQAVSDRGRDGLREDAEERLAHYGTAPPIAVPDATDDERTFSDLEVGKARYGIEAAVVPFRVTARIERDGRREIAGALELVRDDDGWKVAQVLSAGPGDKVASEGGPGDRVPSEGGPRPARAKPSHWLVAVASSLVLTIVSVLVVERQPTLGRDAG